MKEFTYENMVKAAQKAIDAEEHYKADYDKKYARPTYAQLKADRRADKIIEMINDLSKMIFDEKEEDILLDLVSDALDDLLDYYRGKL